MTFEKVQFDFQNKCYVIVGNNLDNDGQKSNGSGKSSFINLISVVILGYSLDGRNVKDMVSWNSEESFTIVSGELENKEHNLTCSITRKIYSNTRSTELQLLVNGKVPSVLPTKKGVANGVDIKEGDKYILEHILDIKADDLLNYFLISGKYYQPFLRVNTDKKLEVINRFSKAHVVDKAISKLETEKEVHTDSILEYENCISTINGYIQALQDSLTGNAKELWEAEKDKKLIEIESQLKKVESDIVELESEATENEAEITELEKQIQEFDQDFLIEQHEVINDLKKKLTQYSKDKKPLREKIAKIENQLAGLISCPKCKHKFRVDGILEYNEMDLDIAERNLHEKEKEEKELEKDIQEFEKEFNEVAQVEQKNIDCTNQINRKKKEIDSIRKQQERLLKEYDSIESKGAHQAALEFIDEQVRVQEQIKDKEEERATQEKQLEEVKNDLNKISEWINNFEDFKFYLGNKPLQIICSLVNQYLKFNGSDLNLQIEGFKRLKSGEISQALQPVIYRNWQQPKDYNSFSAGEQTRLNLACDLAFQQLINSSSKYGGLDLYVNDELCNPLDSLGIQNAAQSFNRLDKTILLVSHSGADLVYDNTIVIEKENQISRIV